MVWGIWPYRMKLVDWPFSLSMRMKVKAAASISFCSSLGLAILFDTVAIDSMPCRAKFRDALIAQAYGVFLAPSPLRPRWSGGPEQDIRNHG